MPPSTEDEIKSILNTINSITNTMYPYNGLGESRMRKIYSTSIYFISDIKSTALSLSVNKYLTNYDPTFEGGKYYKNDIANANLNITNLKLVIPKINDFINNELMYTLKDFSNNFITKSYTLDYCESKMKSLINSYNNICKFKIDSVATLQDCLDNTILIFIDYLFLVLNLYKGIAFIKNYYSNEEYKITTNIVALKKIVDNLNKPIDMKVVQPIEGETKTIGLDLASNLNMLPTKLPNVPEIDFLSDPLYPSPVIRKPLLKATENNNYFMIIIATLVIITLISVSIII